jgi:16S rRNA (cytosine967-C5)-methyltransferase
VLDGPYLRLRPDVHGTDGFFAAVMQRAKPAAEKSAAGRSDADEAAAPEAPGEAAGEA